MSEDKGKGWTRNWLGFIQQAAASATEVLSDAELRRKAGSKIVDGARAGVKGLQGGLQGLDLVARNLVNNVGGGLQQGRRGVQGVLERAQMRLERARLLRALQLEKDMPVDIQIGFHVYEGVPQEIRSRYWMVLVTNPALANPFQELGRFPDVGEFDPDLRHQESIERAARASATEASSSNQPDLSIFVTKPKPRPSESTGMPQPDEAALAELLGQHEQQPDSSRGDDDSQIPDISDLQPRLSGSFATVPQSDSSTNSPHHPMLRGGEALESRMHVGSATDEPSQSADIMTEIPLHGSGRFGPGGGCGERLTDEDEDDESTGLLASKSRGRDDDEWQVVDKLDPLVESTFVGPTSLAHSPASNVTRLSPPPALAAAHAAAASAGASRAANGHGANPKPDAQSDDPSVQSSADCCTPKQEADREERARLKKQAQAQAGKRLHDATENLKAAMSALEWPVTEVKDVSSRYHILLQMTVGQEDVEEIIRRDIHRTFPEHPHFLLGQGQESLYNVLKAYSVTDLVVGYCQGMAFVAGILLMYMPEQLAFKIFCELMDAEGPNIRRYYLPGLDDLKLEMAKFEWLLERHHPRLFQHLQTNGVPCVLYASQWLLTIFACPFPVDFTARIIDIMLLERSDHIVMQTAMAIMAECEDSLLKLDDFEDIITYLKTEPCEWANDKLQGLISAAYLSSVSDSEIQLASEVVTMERVERMMAKPAGRPSQDALINGDVAVTPERAPSADTAATPEDGSARKSLVELDNDMIALVMEQEIENLKWAGPSREHSLIDADVPFLREAARTASRHRHTSSLG